MNYEKQWVIKIDEMLFIPFDPHEYELIEQIFTGAYTFEQKDNEEPKMFVQVKFRYVRHIKKGFFFKKIVKKNWSTLALVSEDQIEIVLIHSNNFKN